MNFTFPMPGEVFIIFFPGVVCEWTKWGQTKRRQAYIREHHRMFVLTWFNWGPLLYVIANMYLIEYAFSLTSIALQRENFTQSLKVFLCPFRPVKTCVGQLAFHSSSRATVCAGTDSSNRHTRSRGFHPRCHETRKFFPRMTRMPSVGLSKRSQEDAFCHCRLNIFS